MRRGWQDFGLYFLITLMIAAGAFGLYDAVAMSAGGWNANPSGPARVAALPPPFAGVSRLCLVLIGADDRPHDKGRSDTLMVLWLNPTLRRAVLLSIPRDLRVEIPGHGSTKINHAYAYGGPPLTVQTVEQLLGERVDGYVKVNFEGFVKAVDLLGGVYLYVPDVEGQGRGMNYDDNWGNLHVHLRPGWQWLNGYQAMGFCRYRKSNYRGLGDGDAGRAERQQQFLRAMLEQKVHLSNLPALLRAGREIMRGVETNLTWRQAVDLLRLLREMKSADLKSVTAPVADAPAGGIYYAALQPEAFQRLREEIEAHMAGLSAAVRGLVLKDGTGTPGVAQQAESRLAAAGFTIIETRPTQEAVAETKVLYPLGQKDMAEAAALALGTGIVAPLPAAEREAEAAAPLQTHLEVILGRDYISAESRQGRKNTGGSREGN